MVAVQGELAAVLASMVLDVGEPAGVVELGDLVAFGAVL